ncbi:MAG: NAD(P)/FAD-dependent oxidoreductase, partial [Thermodesulfobacteriota bacterium]|nr:NAD(P)/FAD-dependent oxidoreductase [Thermodesulfobacteriota bacterium]
GGAVHTEELTLPGFKHNIHSNFHGFIQLGPVLKDLDVGKYHKYIYPDPCWGIIFPDKSGIFQYVGQGIEPIERTCKSIASISPKDAKAYMDFYKSHIELKPLMIGWMFSPPVTPSQQFAPLEGTEMGREIVRMQFTHFKRLTDELFESDQFRAFILMAAVQMGLYVEEFGTGYFFPAMVTLEHDPGWGLSVGGSITLALALEKILNDFGGRVVLNSHVDKILVKNGVATGVEIAGGEKIMAKKAVVSNIDPVGTFIKLVDKEYLEEEFIKKVERWHPGMSIFAPHYAISEPPRWKAAEKNPDADKAWGILIGESEQLVLDYYRDIYAEKVPEDPVFLHCTPTIWDPTQAPPGKHTCFQWVHASYHLRDGGKEKWEEIKEEEAEKVWTKLNKYAPNLTRDKILAAHIETPLDVERRLPELIEGCWLMGAMTQDQTGIFRPFHGYPPYRSAIENLFMCGACTHPGGGCCGAPGYNAAGVICDDLKIKRWWEPMKYEMK